LIFSFHLKSNSVSLTIESGVALGNLWVEDGNLFWLSNWLGGGFLISVFGSGVVFELKNDLSWDWWCWVRSGEVTGGGIWSSGGSVGVIVWDVGWFFSSRWGSNWPIKWAVGTGPGWDFAVDTLWAVNSIAVWVLGEVLFDNDWGPLGEGLFSLLVVEFVSLHGNVLAEVLVTVHAGGKKFDV